MTFTRDIITPRALIDLLCRIRCLFAQVHGDYHGTWSRASISSFPPSSTLSGFRPRPRRKIRGNSHSFTDSTNMHVRVNGTDVFCRSPRFLSIERWWNASVFGSFCQRGLNRFIPMGSFGESCYCIRIRYGNKVLALQKSRFFTVRSSCFNLTWIKISKCVV